MYFCHHVLLGKRLRHGALQDLLQSLVCLSEPSTAQALTITMHACPMENSFLGPHKLVFY